MKSNAGRTSGHNSTGPNIVIDFQSRDKDQSAYAEYYATQPWSSAGYDKKKAGANMDKWEIGGIPTLVLVNDKGAMVSKTCRMDIGKGWDAFESWKKQVGK